MENRFPSYPLKLSANHYQVDLSNSETRMGSMHQPPESASSQKEIFFIKNDLYRLSDHINRIHDSVIPRVQEYESNQNRLESIINRERILEESVRRLIVISTWFCIAIFILFVLIVFLLCHILDIQQIVKYEPFLDWLIGGSATGVIVFLYPLWNLHTFSKRLDTIEKILKLNGNQ